MEKLYTIGHSTHPINTFIEMLNSAGVGCLIDVRSKPYSRYNPQFNRPNLSAAVKAEKILYKFGGDVLGGLNPIEVDDPVFVDKMGKVLEIAERMPVAMMCSEKDPAQCHRAYKLSAWIHRNTDLSLQHIVPFSYIDSREFEGTMADGWVYQT